MYLYMYVFEVYFVNKKVGNVLEDVFIVCS